MIIMKKILGLLGLLMLSCILTSCAKEDPTKQELYQYMSKDVVSISEQHNKAISKYNEYMENAEGDAEALLEALNTDIMVDLKQTIINLDNLVYQYHPAIDLREKYKNAVEKELEAMQAIYDAVKAEDDEALVSANILVAEAQRELDVYHTDVKTKAAEYGISLIENE